MNVYFEWLGYFASALVAISLMMSGIVKLRIINLIGAILLSGYGFIIHAYPVFAVNAIICLVDLYYLWDILKAEEFFNILEASHDSDYMTYFVQFHFKEIIKYMPNFTFKVSEATTAFFILRNSIPAGLIIAEKGEDDSYYIKLDFVIPGYRDLKIGKYVYKNIFTKKNAKKIYSDPGNKKHDDYLRKMGFEKIELSGQPVFCLYKV
jgi:hypothetical protein